MQNQQINVNHARKLIQKTYTKEIQNINYYKNLYQKLNDEYYQALRNGVNTKNYKYTEQGYIIHNLYDAIQYINSKI